jgi:5-methylcytosine-specific restriction endonuclease McrA
VASPQSRWNARNRVALSACRKAWKKANPAKVRASEARYYQTHKPQIFAKVKRQKAAKPGLRTAQRRAYRARKQHAPGAGLTAGQWASVVADSLGICVYCNDRKPLELEHVDPLSGGGSHDIDNAAAACKNCNSAKQEKPLLVWLALRAA